MPTVAAVARGLCSLVLATTLFSGCARRPAPRTAPAPVRAAISLDTVWYMSVRARDEIGRDTRRLADSIEYGIVLSTIGRDADPMRRDVDLTLVDSVRLTKAEFTHALRVRSRSTADTTGAQSDSLVVLMVHGFGTGLHEAWDYAAQAHIRSKSRAPWVVFCWPSNGSGVAWPRAGQILVRAYREDSVAAARSRPAFAQALHTMLDAAGGAQLLLVAHSLGAQLVGETLASDSTLRTALRASPLRTLAYFAPDVAIDRFNAYILPATNALAERIVLYASTKDRLLALSRAVNRSERSGLLRKATLPPAGLELIDVTRGASAENPIQRVFGSHHALRRASAALFDLFSIVAQGYSADCRERLGTAHANTLGIWELTAMSPPLVSVAARCTRVQ